ncbi:MAG: shikimate dehydrogenase [Chloracidobacterium sp.]|nr:shikimate dehydrogenase [Chloracidobacterium sp.]
MNDGLICISTCAETAEELRLQLHGADATGDAVEVRFDCLRPDELQNAIEMIGSIGLQIPLIATFRSPAQGGRGRATFDERVQFWQSLPNDYFAVDLEDDIIQFAPAGVRRIASFHDLDGIPDDIEAVYGRLASSGDIVKIAVRADDATDALAVWNLIEKAKNDGKPMIAIAMGDGGKWTRILGPAHGAFLTFAASSDGMATADGQITAKEMSDVYRVRELGGGSLVFGVLGNPIAQSMSPFMHNPAFASAGIDAVFVSLLVKDIGVFLRRMVRPETREAELNFGGFSVTMPHKQTIMQYLDAIDPTAEKIGAVNTVKIDRGMLTGFNTDAHGFISPLKAKFGDLKGARVAVCGAGGAARAAVYALKLESADVIVLARDKQKARLFGDEFGVEWGQLTEDACGVDIIVDSTPAGMKGPLENETLFMAEGLSGVKLVYDLVTKLTDTPLIREARLAGIPTIGGIEMLIAQGTRQFEIWTGREAPAELMRDSLLAGMDR